MTPPFLLEVPAGEQATGAVATRHGDPPWETAAGGARITRGAGAGRALVAVVGLGHAGLPSAITLRSAGLRVVGIDRSARRLSEIRAGRSELVGAMRERLRVHLRDEDFVLTDELEALGEADAVLICVPSTVDQQGRPTRKRSRAHARRSCSTRMRARRSC